MRSLAKWTVPVAAACCQLAAQQFQFTPIEPPLASSFLTVGADVFGGLAVGDLDGDGLRDIVVPSIRSVYYGSLSVGSLPATLNGTNVNGPVRLRDLDSDGDLDIVILSPAGGPRVLRNNGGTFALFSMGTAFNGSSSTAIGDLDGDGDDDFVVGMDVGSGRSLSLLRNLGNLQFAMDANLFPSLGVAVDQRPLLIDFDRDGDLDVMAWAAGRPTRLLRNSAMTFTDSSNLLPLLPNGAVVQCSADFDGDGWPDVALLEQGNLDVLWGTGGAFTLQSHVLAAAGATALDAADLDGDGDMDLVTTPAGLVVIENRGGRSFSATAIVADTLYAYGLCELDGDGLPDVMFTTLENRRFVEVRFGRGWHSGTRSAVGVRWPGGVTRSGAPAAGDVDGDGRVDLLIPATTELVVDHALGDGRYTMTESPQVHVSASWPDLPTLADLDNDGDLDLVVAGLDSVRIYGNDGRGTFTSLLQLPMASMGIDDTCLGDVNGDGLLDILRSAGSWIGLVRNQGGGTFASPVVLTSGGGAIELCDVDGDGDLDLVTTLTDASSRRVLLVNDGAGNFATSFLAVGFGAFPQQIVCGDFDNDGDQDLLVANGNSLLLLVNGGGGVFAQAATTPVATLNSNIVAGDVDGNGSLDVLLVDTGGLQLLVNDGSGGLTSVSAQRIAPQFLNSLSQWRIALADADGDGDPDILMGAIGSNDPQRLLFNNLRQLRTLVSPRIGTIAEFALANGPRFGAPGAAVLAFASGRAAVPIGLPGILGSLQIDPATAQVQAAVLTSPIGVSSAFVPVPMSPLLVGMEAWLQGAILWPGRPPGLTNAIYEVVLR